MHPVSVLTFGIFLAGYITARWDLVTRLYELAIFAWDHGVIVSLQPELAGTSINANQWQTRAAKGFAVLSIFFLLLLIPIERIAAQEADLVSAKFLRTRASSRADTVQRPRAADGGISAREQLRRRGSF
jgi:hypothetical protein